MTWLRQRFILEAFSSLTASGWNLYCQLTESLLSVDGIFRFFWYDLAYCACMKGWLRTWHGWGSDSSLKLSVPSVCLQSGWNINLFFWYLPKCMCGLSIPVSPSFAASFVVYISLRQFGVWELTGGLEDDTWERKTPSMSFGHSFLWIHYDRREARSKVSWKLASPGLDGGEKNRVWLKISAAGNCIPCAFLHL